MNRLFKRHGAEVPRRNSDDDKKNMQFWTPRGALPAKVVEQEVSKVGDPRGETRYGHYPKRFRNDEEIIDPREVKDLQGVEPNKRLYEIPVNTRMDLNQPGTGYRQVQRNREPVHHNDRARQTQRVLEMNDPGEFRGIVPTNRTTGQTEPVVAVVYHPEGNIDGFQRSRVEPMDRGGRQHQNRFDDESNRRTRETRPDGSLGFREHNTNGGRTGTWPPRDQDANDLNAFENQHQQVRRPRNAPPQPRVRRRDRDAALAAARGR